MVEVILDGRLPEGVTLPVLMEGVPVGWGKQWASTGAPP